MYEKNLTKDLRLRLSEEDFNFLVDFASIYDFTISQAIRFCISHTKYSFINETEGCPNGDTKTDIYDQL